MIKGIDYTGICVVFYCVDGYGNVLLSKRGANCRDENFRWDTGSGALKFGETIEDALIREISEEYTALIYDYQYLGFRNIKRNTKGKITHWIAFDYFVLIDKNVKNGEPEKFDEIKWFPESNLPSPMHSQFNSFFNCHNNKIKVLRKNAIHVEG